MIRQFIDRLKNREIDSTVDTTQQNTTIEGFSRGAEFDDHIDTRTELSHTEAFHIVLRTYGLIREVKGLFTAKFLLDFGPTIPLLFTGWFFKIMTDHVILGVPLIADEVNFPPHMHWILRILEGREPMNIMFITSIMFLVGLFIIGLRAGGTGAGLFAGRDTASTAENAISGGGSDRGGLWGLVEFWVNVRLTQRMANNARTRLFARLSRSPMTTIDDHRVGDVVYRVLYDTAMVPHSVYELTLAPFGYTLGIGLVVYQIWTTYGEMSPWLAVFVCITFPIVIIVTLPATSLIRRTNQNKRAAGSATTNAMEETMNNISAVQSLGGIKQEKERFAKRSAAAYWRERIAMVVGVILSSSINFIILPIGFVVSYLVTEEVIKGNMTVGDFGALYGMYMSLSWSVRYMGGFWIRIQDNVAALRRVFFFLDSETDDDLHKGGQQLPPIKHGVSIEDVSFNYPDGRTALRNINIELRVGEIVAFVGPTGAGKTSLAYLIPAFLRPSQGRIRIDNLDINDVELDTLRMQVAYVFQEHILLSESIRSNLLLANPNASEELLRDALEMAGCTEFVGALSDGIDTVLGRSGDTLSVGQQQRLSIARGLVSQAKILILDEPTAALDPRTENALVSALRNASTDRLVIIIAHRLSTIKQADQIIFLDDGTIEDRGTHEELMTKIDGAYRQFVELQSSPTNQ